MSWYKMNVMYTYIHENVLFYTLIIIEQNISFRNPCFSQWHSKKNQGQLS